MSRTSMSRLGGLVALAVVLVPARAWAPPLCSYQEKVAGETLTLQIRLATVDGVQVTLPRTGYSLQSGCSLNALTGTLADPDAPGSKRDVVWGLRTP